MFSAKRNPLSGGNSGHTRSDSLHPKLFIECKINKRSALWTLFNKTKKLAESEKKTPVLAIGLKNHEGFLLVTHINDCKKILKEIK